MHDPVLHHWHDWWLGVIAPPCALHWPKLSHTSSIHLWPHISEWRNQGLGAGMLCLCCPPHRLQIKNPTSLDPVFDSYCISLIEWPHANAGDCRSQTLSQIGNAEKINQQLSIMDTEWHHRYGTGPHTWINANKHTHTMIRHLWNLQSICLLNSGPLVPCPPATLCSAVSSLLCLSMETRQPDKTWDWPAAACSSR